MKLLTAEEVRTKGLQEKDIQAEIIRKNNEEAASSARRLNDAKEREAAELIAIEGRLSKTRLHAEITIGDLASQVHELEKRKAEALKPIRDREIEIEKRELELASRVRALNNAFIELEEDHIRIRETRESYEARFATLQNWEVNLNQKKNELEKERNELNVYIKNSKYLLKKEQTRLREYFEAEDQKLNLKRKHG